MPKSQTNDSPGVRSWITILLAAMILVPSLWGFGNKFLELVALGRGEVDGVFAVTPVVNYLLASLGFLCLFCWAAANDMFHDIERPKHTMLENEAMLDAMNGAPQQHEATKA
ncbi:MAG: hypothetical protein ACR2NU_09715 [Aeoliella sp.]